MLSAWAGDCGCANVIVEEAFVVSFSFIFCKLLLLLELLMVCICIWGCVGERCCAKGLSGGSEVLVFSSVFFKLVLLFDVLIVSILSSLLSIDVCSQELWAFFVEVCDRTLLDLYTWRSLPRIEGYKWRAPRRYWCYQQGYTRVLWEDSLHKDRHFVSTWLDKENRGLLNAHMRVSKNKNAGEANSEYQALRHMNNIFLLEGINPGHSHPEGVLNAIQLRGQTEIRCYLGR